MFSVLRLFVGKYHEILSNRVTNNKISGKFAHTTLHQNFAVNLMDTPGYYCAVLSLLILAIIPSVNYALISPKF